jgi:RES domain-containing protein
VHSRALRTVKPRRFAATVSRIIARVYGDRPLSLEGSLLYGGRYNPPSEFGALYCGLSPEICWAELENKHEGPLKRVAFRVVRVAVRLQRVLDLTEGAVQEMLGVTSADLTRRAEYTLTQAIARAARDTGFEAILAPSSTGTGAMLAIFADRLDDRSRVTVGAKPTRGGSRPSRRPR